MIEITAREAQPRDLWKSIPIDLALSVMAIIAAGGAKYMGLMP